MTYILFITSDCEHCHQITSYIKKTPYNIKIIDAHIYNEMANIYNISRVPTLIITDHDQVFKSIVGLYNIINFLK